MLTGLTSITDGGSFRSKLGGIAGVKARNVAFSLTGLSDTNTKTRIRPSFVKAISPVLKLNPGTSPQKYGDGDPLPKDPASRGPG